MSHERRPAWIGFASTICDTPSRHSSLTRARSCALSWTCSVIRLSGLQPTPTAMSCRPAPEPPRTPSIAFSERGNEVLATVWLHSGAKIAPGCTPERKKPQVRPCGDEENRTLNPRLAKAVLCQLSYVP